jgi:ElaB/YqjD/DUF883 family membrane-anchored ribosome-binding protein
MTTESFGTSDTIRGATETLKNGAGHAEAEITSIGTKAAASAQDAVRKLRDQATEMGGKAYDQALEAGQYARRTVEERPWITALATGLLGLVVGALIARAATPKPRTVRDYAEEYLPRKLRRG